MLHACMESNLTLRPAKHEEEAICEANERNPNVCRIARVRKHGAIRWFSKKESQMLHACMESNLTLRPAKHEEEAICDKSVVNI